MPNEAVAKVADINKVGLTGAAAVATAAGAVPLGVMYLGFAEVANGISKIAKADTKGKSNVQQAAIAFDAVGDIAAGAGAVTALVAPPLGIIVLGVGGVYKLVGKILE